MIGNEKRRRKRRKEEEKKKKEKRRKDEEKNIIDLRAQHRAPRFTLLIHSTSVTKVTA